MNRSLSPARELGKILRPTAGPGRRSRAPALTTAPRDAPQEPRTGLAARNEAYFAQLRRQADEDAAQKAQAEARLDDDERARLEQQRQEAGDAWAGERPNGKRVEVAERLWVEASQKPVEAEQERKSRRGYWRPTSVVCGAAREGHWSGRWPERGVSSQEAQQRTMIEWRKAAAIRCLKRIVRTSGFGSGSVLRFPPEAGPPDGKLTDSFFAWRCRTTAARGRQAEASPAVRQLLRRPEDQGDPPTEEAYVGRSSAGAIMLSPLPYT
eukprot:scaffold1241_cov227-Pinguiococcus_pyrenoidosus.AAC.3